MPILFREQNQSITLEDLAGFEKAHNIHLPEDYRAFLLATNGGLPEVYHGIDFMMDGQPTSTLVDIVFGITPEKYCGFTWILTMYSNRLPSNLLPIASDPGHSLICLSISGDDKGSVYFWDGDWEVTEGTPDYSNVHRITNSFQEFLEKVYPD